MDICIVGIDGSGKGTAVSWTRRYLNARGVTVAYIHTPDFEKLPRGFQTFGRGIVRAWRFADAHDFRFLIIPVLAIASLLFFAARHSAKDAQVRLIERHPRIEVPVFARLFGGVAGECIGSLAARCWPMPDAAIMLEIPVELALERIRKRGDPYQMHEAEESLRRLSGFLKTSVICAVPVCAFLDARDFSCEPYLEEFVVKTCGHLFRGEVPHA